MSGGLKAARVRVDLHCLAQDMERLRSEVLSLWPHSELASDLRFRLDQTQGEIRMFLKEVSKP